MAAMKSYLLVAVAAAMIAGSVAQPAVTSLSSVGTVSNTAYYSTDTTPTFSWATDTTAGSCSTRLRANKYGFSSLAQDGNAYTTGAMSETTTDGAVVDSELEAYGHDWTTTTCTSTSCSKTYTTLPDGYYTFGVACETTAGSNTFGTMQMVWLKIDNNAPVTTLTHVSTQNSYDPSPSDKTSFAFSVSAVDYYGNTDYTSTTANKGDCASASTSSTTTAATCELTGVSFECKLNNGAWGSCGLTVSTTSSDTSTGTYTYTVSNPGTGQHTLQVRATDPAGNVESYPAFYSWSVETYTSSTGCTYAYNLDSAGYTATGSSGANAYQTLTGLSDGTHTFTIKAFDAYSNPTADSSLYSFDWTVDTTAPTTTVTTTWASQAQPSITSAVYEWSFSEASSFSKYSTDGSTFVLTGGKTDTKVTLPTGTYSVGSRSFKVFGIDQLGNIGSTVTDSFTVEPIDTSLTCTGCVSCSATVTAPIASSTVVFTIGATVDTDTSPTFTYEYALGDGKYKKGQHYPNFGIKGFKDGDYTLKARAYTESGRVDPSPAEMCFKVDLTAPVVRIMSGPAAVSSDANPTVSGMIVDENINTAGAQYRLVKEGVYDSGYTTLGNPVVDNTTFSIPLANLTDGMYTIYIKSTDLAGNVGEAAEHQWFVDFGPPDTSVQAGPATPTPVEEEFVFVLACSEPPCTFEYKVDSADAYTMTEDSTVEVKDVPAGVHTLEVRSKDVAGNVDPTPAAYTWTVYGEEMYSAFGANAGFRSTGVAPAAYEPPSYDAVQVDRMEPMGPM